MRDGASCTYRQGLACLYKTLRGIALARQVDGRRSDSVGETTNDVSHVHVELTRKRRTRQRRSDIVQQRTLSIVRRDRQFFRAGERGLTDDLLPSSLTIFMLRCQRNINIPDVMARDPRTSQDDGAAPLDWFATETSIIEISSTSDASAGVLPNVPTEQLRSALDWFATERSLVEISSTSNASNGALLDGLATDVSIVDIRSTSDAYRGALPQVPEGPLRSATAAPRNGAASRQPNYALAAAILVAAVGSAWWAKPIPQTRSLAGETTRRAPAVTPVVVPPINVPGHAPTELLRSMEMRPSTRTPIARVVANAPRMATATTAHESRQPRGAAVRSGMSDTRLAASVPNVVPATRTDPAPTASIAANPRGASPASEPPSATAAPTVASTALPQRPPVLAVRPAPEAIPTVAGRTEQSEIQRVLGQYRTAYQRLDAEAARAVWPSVDARALARAFDTLDSQELSFDICVFEITGEIGTAQCRGTATYTPKVGSRKSRLEPRQWTFHLRKMDESWKIQSAQTKR